MRTSLEDDFDTLPLQCGGCHLLGGQSPRQHNRAAIETREWAAQPEIWVENDVHDGGVDPEVRGIPPFS
jgi:hypothetical protein